MRVERAVIHTPISSTGPRRIPPRRNGLSSKMVQQDSTRVAAKLLGFVSHVQEGQIRSRLHIHRQEPVDLMTSRRASRLPAADRRDASR